MSVFSNMKPKTHVGRNGFDLSRYRTFSQKVGIIKPVFHQLTLPNSDYSLDLQQLCRTQPLNKAAFTGFSLNYDVLWCPLNHLYTGFNSFIAQTYLKETVYQPRHDHLPVFDLGGFIRKMLPVWLYDYMIQMYGDEYSETNSAYFPKCIFTSSHSDSSVSLSILDSLDLYGYGNYLPMVKSLYKALRTYCDEQLNVNIVTFGGLVAGWLANKFGNSSDTFDLDEWVTFVDDAFTDNEDYFSIKGALSNLIELENDKPKVFPTLWPVLAYNKFFYEFYRSSYYDKYYSLFIHTSSDAWSELSYGSVFNDDTSYYTWLFNIDDYSDSFKEIWNLSFDDYALARLIAMFAYKPHLYKRDLFTGVLPSTQVGTVSVASNTSMWSELLVSNRPLHSTTDNADTRAVYVAGGSTTVSAPNNVGYVRESFRLNPGQVISVLELRRADAMQRFMERALRAGDKVEDLFKAHGWDAPMSHESLNPLFLGSFDGRLDINTVASTTQNEVVDLGQLAANGVAVVSGEKVHFKSHDFGVLMVLMYIQKDCVYNSYGLNPQHMMVEAFDFPYPEFQNISLQPIQNGNLSLFPHTSLTGVRLANSHNFNDVIGYLPSYMPFKTAVDEVNGEFYSDSDFIEENGVFSDWVSSRRDVVDVKKLSFLYIHPSCADSVFVVRANDLPSTDQFLINCRFDCLAIEPLSVMGLPL